MLQAYVYATWSRPLRESAGHVLTRLLSSGGGEKFKFALLAAKDLHRRQVISYSVCRQSVRASNARNVVVVVVVFSH